jgi:uncharacterized protein (DUF1501 family)
LVVIQLDGGNDGLNTVIPFRDENYARLRPKLALKDDRRIKITDDVALHASLKPVAALFEDKSLAIVQGVGYPNPNRSHFRSMAIWQSSRLEDAEHGQYGWLGRTLDKRATAESSPDAVYAGTGAVPVALWGRRSVTAAISSLNDLSLSVPPDILRSAMAETADAGELARLVARASDDAFTTAQRLTAVTQAPKSGATGYGDSRLAEQLRIVSALLKSGSPTRVFYTSQSGYDTHAVQANEHSQLLRTLSGALKGFLNDLSESGLADRVLVLAFSEFGRRVAENDSAGTDHGAAGPVFLAGNCLAGGVIGSTPNLADLVDGDVRTTVDFRQVYATILEEWLDVRAAEVLGGVFAPLPLFKSA